MKEPLAKIALEAKFDDCKAGFCPKLEFCKWLETS